MWPRARCWHYALSHDSGVALQWLVRSGAAPRTIGALLFPQQSIEQLKLIATICWCFGTNSNHDLYLIPASGEAVVQTDHHGLLWAQFASIDIARRVVERMRECGWEIGVSEQSKITLVPFPLEHLDPATWTPRSMIRFPRGRARRR